MSDLHRVATLSLLILLSAQSALSQESTPQQLTVQGYLDDRSGGSPEPANGSYTMIFTLFDHPQTGTPLASIEVPDVPVVDGLFTASLPFSQQEFEGAARYVEVTVNGEVLSPRIQLASTPFAYVADLLDGVEAADLEESGEIDAAMATHEAAPDPHPAYLQQGGELDVGSLDVSGDLSVDGDVTVAGEGHFSGAIKTGTATLQGHSVGFGLTAPRDGGDSLIDVSPQPLDGTGGAYVRFFRYSNTTGPKRLSLNRGDGSAAVDAQIGAGGSDTFFTGGNVGIGTTSPKGKLHVEDGEIALGWSADPPNERLLYLMRTVLGDSSGYKFSWRNDDGSFRNNVLEFDRSGDVYVPDGNVGIGTISPSAKLDVVGDTKVSGVVESSGGFQFPDGTVQTTAAAGGGSGRPDPPCFDPLNRFVNCANGTVTDTVTGLIWLEDANCDGAKSWEEGNEWAAALGNGLCGLGDGSSAGDWRLPTREEWEAIVGQAVGNGCSEPSFPDTVGTGCCGTDMCPLIALQSVGYWTSTTYADAPEFAWIARLNVGSVDNNGLKVNATYVSAVRGGHGSASTVTQGGAGDGHSLDAADGDPEDALYVDQAGRVGIGTTSPSPWKLQVNGPVDFASEARLGRASFMDPNLVPDQVCHWTMGPNVAERTLELGRSCADTGPPYEQRFFRRMAFHAAKVDIDVDVDFAGSLGAPDGSLDVAASLHLDNPAELARLNTEHPWVFREGAGGGLELKPTTAQNTFVIATHDGSDIARFHESATGSVVVSLPHTFVDVLTITGGADIAEPFPIAENRPIAEGSIVVIDPQHQGSVTLSERAYDRRVAGIVSGAGDVDPGLKLMQNGVLDEGANVALSGRVYALADASYGPIEPGDLLTTSDTPGHAMKVADFERAPGAILGKAMSSLEEGRGLVLTLVTLQ